MVERAALKKRLPTIDTDEIRTMLSINGLELREGGGVFYLLSESEERRRDAGELRRVLHTLVDRVELNPKTRELTLRYRLNVKSTGVRLASPRRSATNPAALVLRLAGRTWHVPLRYGVASQPPAT